LEQHKKTAQKQKLARNAALTLIAVGVAVGGTFATLHLMKPAVIEAQPSGNKALVNNKASLAMEKARAKAINPSAQVKDEHGHSHEVPEGLKFSSPDDYKLASHWFESSDRTLNRFSISRTKLVVDKSCEGRSEMLHSSFEEALQREASYDVSEVTPSDVVVQDIAQFWKIGPTYYKMSGRWERDQPATYLVNLFSSSSPDFSRDLRVLPLPTGVAHQVDIMTLGDALDKEVIAAVAVGGERGSRLVHAFYPQAKTNETLEVRVNNGRPVSWMFGNGRCQRRITGDAYCKCVSDSDVNHVVANAAESQKEQHSHKHAAHQKKEHSHRVHD
jgi:hypothetical protein